MKQSAKKTLKLGTYTLVICAVAIAIVIFINFLAGILPTSVTRLEMTGKDLFSLSDETKKLCGAVEQDVTLSFLTYEGQEDGYIETLLNRYADLSSHIRVEKIDPRTNPGFLEKYVGEEGASANSVVCRTADRFRLVDYYEIYTYSEELQQQMYYAYMQTGSTDGISPDLFQGEMALTAAIDYVTAAELPTVYYVTGHGETAIADIDATMATLIEKENVSLQELNLLRAGEIPEDAHALLFTIPTADLTKEETDLLRGYAEKGGKFLLLSGWKTVSAENTPNLCEFLAEFGVEPVDGLVCDTGNYFTMVNYYLMPTFNTSCSLGSRVNSGLNFVLPYAQGIVKTETQPEGVTVTDILKTSDGAYARMSISEENQSITKSSDDPDGPFMLGVEAERNADGAKLLWYSSYYVAYSTSQGLPQGNSDLFIASLISLCGKTNSVTAGSQLSLTVEPLVVPEGSATVWGALLIGLVPAFILVCGITVFVRRRRK